MESHALEGGFADAPRDAAFAFRSLMNSMARPGTIETLTGALPPEPLSVAAGTALLTLTDPDTPVYLSGKCDTKDVRDWIAFHIGAPLTGPATAMFAVGTWDDLMPLTAYPIGTPEYPDSSTTLIVECNALEAKGAKLTGPGIRDTAELSLPDLEALAWNARRFPLGLDFYFTSGDRIAALPRSTRIALEGAS